METIRKRNRKWLNSARGDYPESYIFWEVEEDIWDRSNHWDVSGTFTLKDCTRSVCFSFRASDARTLAEARKKIGVMREELDKFEAALVAANERRNEKEDEG